MKGLEKNILDLFESKYKGNYVDIGCFHPTKYSNTRKMYNLGWSGLNIDLNPITIELFNFKRPKDINVCAALSNKIKKTKLYHHHDLSSQNTLCDNHVLWMKKNFGLNKKITDDPEILAFVNKSLSTCKALKPNVKDSKKTKIDHSGHDH